MANPTCTIANLNVACFRGQVLDQQRRKALLVYLMAAELNAIGGTNYLTGLISPASGGLLGDTNAFTDFKVSLDDIGVRTIGTFELAIQLRNAESAGVETANIQTRMQQTKCLLNVDPDMLTRMILFLGCQLGVSKAYPQ